MGEDKKPAYSLSWKLWCLAFAMLRMTEAERAEVFNKQARHAPELRARMQTIRTTRAIPVGEFL